MVVVVMVFVVVVVLVPLHHLSQPPVVQHHAGQVPHVFFLHHRSWSCQGAQGPVALALLGPLLVLAVGGRGLVRRGLAGERRGRRDAPVSHHLAADLRGRRAAVSLRRAEGVFARVLASRAGDGVEAVRGLHGGLQAAVVGMGVSVFWFVGARAGLIGRPGLRLGLRRLGGGGCDGRQRHMELETSRLQRNNNSSIAEPLGVESLYLKTPEKKREEK